MQYFGVRIEKTTSIFDDEGGDLDVRLEPACTASKATRTATFGLVQETQTSAPLDYFVFFIPRQHVHFITYNERGRRFISRHNIPSR